jgi:uncharacterized protein
MAVVEGLDEARRLPEEIEPVLIDDGRLRPLELVEDEILLALPQVPMHGADDCAVRLVSADSPKMEPAPRA